MKRISVESTAIALALLAIGGCTRTIHRSERTTPVEAPAAWSTKTALDGPRDKGDWWTSFDDDGLNQAVAEALSQNQELVAVAARIDQARAQARIAGAGELPAVDVAFNPVRQRQNFIGFPIPGREDSVLTSVNTNMRLAANLTWELDFWGRIKNGKVAALADAEAVSVDLEAARLSLAANASKAWFAAIEAKRQVAIARASLQSFQVSAERVRSRFLTGIRPPLDLRLALTEVATAEAELERRNQILDAAIRGLEALIGVYPAGGRTLAEDLPDTPPDIPAGLPSDLVYRRPDLAAQERRLLASDARIAQAKAELRPRFNITAALGTASSNLSGVLDGSLLIWSLAGGVVQPLFQNGRLKAGVLLNEAQAREAMAIYESAVLEAYREVETALAAERLLAAQENALAAASRQSLAARDLADQRYRSGLADIITLLASQRSAIQSESLLMNVRRLRLENRVNLHLALGGGFEVQSAPLLRGADDPDSERKKEKL